MPPATLDESEQGEIQSDPRLLSVDFLARRVVPMRVEVEDRRIISALLGLEGDWQRGVWLAEPDVAERLACPRPTVRHAMRRAREHWGRQPWMTVLREDLAAVLEKNGGVMTVDELSAAVLAARGSAADEPARFQVGSGCLIRGRRDRDAA